MSKATDPIADMFTLVRNANHIHSEKVDIPASKYKLSIAHVLKQEGFISNYKLIEDRKQGILRIYLKYTSDGEGVLKDIKRISRPGLRRFCNKDKLPRVFRGLGTAMISTSRGILTDVDCRNQGLGGEIIGYVW